mmetsp:Transcript_45758/g.114704  ORF Transcript_45758/g.114704 Transcript_45758/m.114704 type:complete len:209 (+) Transcript_45758:262-888(+)
MYRSSHRLASRFHTGAAGVLGFGPPPPFRQPVRKWCSGLPSRRSAGSPSRNHMEEALPTLQLPFTSRRRGVGLCWTSLLVLEGRKALRARGLCGGLPRRINLDTKGLVPSLTWLAMTTSGHPNGPHTAKALPPLPLPSTNDLPRLQRAPSASHRLTTGTPPRWLSAPSMTMPLHAREAFPPLLRPEVSYQPKRLRSQRTTEIPGPTPK